MKNIYLSNFYSNAHTIYKDMILNNTLTGKINYISLKESKYISYIKRIFINPFTLKLPFYKNENIKNKNSIIFNLGIINYSKNNCYFFLEHFFILNCNFNILRNKYFIYIVKKILEKNNCKKIVCLSNESKKRIDIFFNSDIITNKTTCIYPSIGNNINSKINIKTKKFTLLFISNWDFYSKGGREVILLYKKYFKNNSNYKFIIKCNNIPNEYKIIGNNIEYIENNISYEEIENLYKKSNILLQPLYKSGYGVFLEAMKFGLPIITSKVFDIPEIVQEGINGYTIDFCHSLFDTNNFYKKFNSIKDFDKFILKTNISNLAINEMYKKIIYLNENRNIYKRISLNNLYEVEKGRFSRKRRDKAILDLIK